MDERAMTYDELVKAFQELVEWKASHEAAVDRVLAALDKEADEWSEGKPHYEIAITIVRREFSREAEGK